MSYKKDLRDVENARRRHFRNKSDERSILHHATDNARGKLKIRSRTSGPLGRALNHRKPRGCSFVNPKYRVTNPLSWLGYTDSEYLHYQKTGELKKDET